MRFFLFQKHFFDLFYFFIFGYFLFISFSCRRSYTGFGEIAYNWCFFFLLLFASGWNVHIRQKCTIRNIIVKNEKETRKRNLKKKTEEENITVSDLTHFRSPQINDSLEIFMSMENFVSFLFFFLCILHNRIVDIVRYANKH